MVRDPPAVPRNPETKHREVSLGDPLFAATVVAGPGDPEEVALLVVLVESEDIVLQVVLLLLFGSFRIRRDEEDVLAVRGERKALNRALVACQWSGFPTTVRQEVDLGEGVLAPARDKGHVAPVR